MTRLFLLRHGEVETRYHRVFGGRINMELSPEGHRQAHALAEYLKRVSFDAIYASPMKRAQQTLAPMLASHKGEPITVADLCEVHFGDWTGLTWQQVHDKFQVSAFHWLEMLEQAKVPNGECGRTFRERIEPCVKRVLESHPAQTVAIVCHGGVIRMILSILLNLPLSRTAAFEVEYASLTEVHYSPGKVVVDRLNFVPWRDWP